MSNVQGYEVFRREDKQIDKYLKVTALGIGVLQFFNSIFGFFISLDAGYKSQVSNWKAFTFGVILFYLILMATCFCSIISIIQHWHRFIITSSVLYLIYFIFGLINVGLRANWFCFLLLIFASIINVIIGYHFLSIERCSASGHHFTCRGRCIRVEQVKKYDAMLFQNSQTLVRLFGYDSAGNEFNQQPEQQSPQQQSPQQQSPLPDTTHISFTNEMHQEALHVVQNSSDNVVPDKELREPWMNKIY